MLVKYCTGTMKSQFPEKDSGMGLTRYGAGPALGGCVSPDTNPVCAPCQEMAFLLSFSFAFLLRYPLVFLC